MKSKWPMVEAKLDLIASWLRDGIYEKDICAKLGIGISTWEDYKTKHEELVEVLKNSKEVADAKVENKLFENAVGYHYTEEVLTTKREVIYENGKRVKEISEPVVVTLKKFHEGETGAQCFWLKNRRPDKWRDKRDVEVGNIDNKPFKFDSLSTEEIKRMLDEEDRDSESID